MLGAGVGKDGSIVLFGATGGRWGDMHYGSADFIVAKFHSNGSLLWGWQVIRKAATQNAWDSK